MSTAARPKPPGSDARVRAVEVTDDLIVAHLVDGRTISVPLAWSWRLAGRPAQQRRLRMDGVSSAEHLRALARAGAEGAIVGTALYSGKLKLEEALAAC